MDRHTEHVDNVDGLDGHHFVVRNSMNHKAVFCTYVTYSL